MEIKIAAAIAKELPDGVIREEYTRRFAAHRPRVMSPCPKCGEKFSARELRSHKPACGLGRPRKDEKQ